MSYAKRDISVEPSDAFLKSLKKLLKRYRSLYDDVTKLIVSLKENPMQGADLGNGFRKVRMAITSKGKGKSAGARVITFTLLVANGNLLILAEVYDKADRGTISDKELKQLLKDITGDMQ